MSGRGWKGISYIGNEGFEPWICGSGVIVIFVADVLARF
jgi:hypothetical protein